MSSCERKSSAPKKLDIPTAVVSVDTVARLSDAIQCHVHVDFTYLKESKHATVNDSLLRMGLLQPDYFAINNDKTHSSNCYSILCKAVYKAVYGNSSAYSPERER